MMVVGIVLVKLIDLYVFLIFLWVLGSWFQQWHHQEWYRILRSVVEPYINLFRGLRLHMGMLDLTPAVAMIFLTLFRSLIIAATFGRL